MSMVDENVSDVIVVGGGPAGTTAAALLARQGWQVTLFEAGHHPKFHIGESLLPMNLPIFERLGVLERVRAIGQYKPGADFTVAEEGAHHQAFPFNRALRDSPTHAFQVLRSEFDALLFENCEQAGVRALAGHRVAQVSLSESGLHSVMVESGGGKKVEWQCKYILDASGQKTLLASQENWRVWNPVHRSAAVFGHFNNVEARTGKEEGNISIYWFDKGWIWMIPLPDGGMSIGAVCKPEYLKQRQAPLEDFLLDTLRRSPPVAARLAHATLRSDVTATANYSYYSKRQMGAGYALIGDAYAFIDPVFSNGVYLAMSSATAVVPVVDAWLKGQRLRHAYRSLRYRMKMRKGLAAFSWFIYRFNTPTMTALFRNPRNILKVEQAVTSMLAGDVYRGGMVRVRLLIFKLIFALMLRFGSAAADSDGSD